MFPQICFFIIPSMHSFSSKYLGEVITTTLRSAMRGWCRFFVSAAVTLLLVAAPLASSAQSPATATPAPSPKVQPTAQPSPGAPGSSNDAFLRLDSLRLRIVFDLALFDA